MTWQDLLSWFESVNPVLTAIVLLFAIVGGFYGFYSWLLATVLRPKLLLTIPADPYLSSTDGRTGSVNQWALVEVRSNRRRQFRNCRAYLTKIVALSDSPEEAPREYIFGKVLLLWGAARQQSSMDLLRGEPARLCLFRFGGGVLDFARDSEYKSEAMVRQIGKYVFSVECVGDNINSTAEEILVDFAQRDKPPDLSLWHRDISGGHGGTQT